MLPSQKACPSCKLPAPIYAAVCENCGHPFRTQFMPPTDQTQILPELPASHFPPLLARRKRMPLAAILPVVVGLVLVATVVIAASLARTHVRNQVNDAVISDARSTGVDVKNTPGHQVKIADAEAIVPLSSQHQVLESLGAPLQNVDDIWSYPTENGAAVGVKFAGDDSAKYVQGIVIADAAGNLVWAKTPHLWKSMPMTKFVASKHGLPLRSLKRYLAYFTE